MKTRREVLAAALVDYEFVRRDGDPVLIDALNRELERERARTRHAGETASRAATPSAVKAEALRLMHVYYAAGNSWATSYRKASDDLKRGSNGLRVNVSPATIRHWRREAGGT